MNQLLLGSGAWDWPDWFKIDSDPDSPADYIGEVPPLPDVVRRYAWDVVMGIHFIEHLAVWDAETLLRECYDILVPGGKLILEQPDINYAARVLLGLKDPPGGEPGQFDYWALWGDPTHRKHGMLHKWGYNPRTLSSMVQNIGFSKVYTLPATYHVPVRDFRLEAVK